MNYKLTKSLKDAHLMKPNEISYRLRNARYLRFKYLLQSLLKDKAPVYVRKPYFFRYTQ